MPITLVRYSAEFSVNGLKRWISCESSVLKEGDEDKEIDAAIAFCFKTNDRVHGWQQPIQSSEPAILPTTIVEKEPVSFLSVEDDIRSFTDYDKLGKVYGMLVKVQPELAPIYEEMRGKLKAAEIKSILNKTNAYYDPLEQLDS